MQKTVALGRIVCYHIKELQLCIIIFVSTCLQLLIITLHRLPVQTLQHLINLHYINC